MTTHTVLVVDDEPASLRAVQRVLADDYRVVAANSAADGLRVLASELVGLIIADHRMPEMTGTEFLARAATLHPDAIRVLFTGYTDVETVIGAINAGQVYSYLTKPWEARELQLAVRRGFERYEAELERRRLLRELEQACARARREAEQKGRLLTMASHELGTPLHVLLNALELLGTTELPPRPREWLSTAQRNGEWLGRGLAQMTAAARLRTDGLRLRLAPVCLPALWRTLCEELRERLALRAVAIIDEMPDDLPAVAADAKWLRQAIASVLSNAIRFTPDGGRVEVRGHYQAAEGYVVLTVRDTGIGIEPAHLDEIFEPFSVAGGDPLQHASGSLAFGSRGLGLGLAITRAIMTLHGGRITAESVAGAGSCFTVAIPIDASAVPRPNFE